MREIRFRAWNGVNMAIPTYINTDGKACYHSSNSSGVFEAKHEIVMQYTGLNDKKGNEIYEGDIVKIYNLENKFKHGEPEIDWRIFAVEHNRYTFAFNNSVLYMPLSDYSAYDGTEYNIEIIGNIYQNPDLLTNK